DHTSIKQLYLLSSSEDRIDQNLFDKFDQMQKKVKEITDSLIKPGMTDLDKEQILHDYLVTHIKYDKQNFINNTLPDDSHTAYGALIKNIAVCDGYARSFQILLNAVGIQSQMIIGDFNSLNGSLSTSVKNGENEIKWRHAWNIVKLDNKYYQVDVTADDPLTQDGSDIFNHQYFNISDRQMGADHQWDRSSYAPCVEDNKLFDLNAKESKNVIIADNAYYFIDPDGGIRKMQTDGSNDIKISDDKAIEIVLLGDYIYYINDSDGRSIYRIKTDGSEKSKLNDTKAWEIDGGGGSIYYIGNYKVNKLGPNGENQGQLTYDDVVSWIYVNDTNLYYKSFNFDSGARLEKADLNGGNAVQIVNDEPTGFDVTYNGRNVDYWYEHDEHILDGWIYYVNKYDSKSIYRAKLDGTENVKICDDSVVDRSDIEISGNYIYYKNSKDGNKYYRVNMDGTNKQSLE
ncbi:MAG: DUF5050 domain-containing protein, partial [Bacillota bacterium]|nr:DUF5050 domain-containing protein [Bacillota bacterium]